MTKPATSKKPSQRERFIEAAREAETDDSPEAFERIFAKVVPPKGGNPKPKSGKSK